MPQEPKKKHSKASKRMRRTSIKLESLALVRCKNCGRATIPHQVCKACGFYGGKQINTKTSVKIIKA